jgi:DNA-binding PadR family transcriptional regulator
MRKTDAFDLGRFSDPAVLILSSLVGGPKHGYGLMQDIAEFSGTRLEPGTMYGALSRLEQRGWVVALEPDGPRRPYRITEMGTTVLREQLATMRQIVATAGQRLAVGSEQG